MGLIHAVENAYLKVDTPNGVTFFITDKLTGDDISLDAKQLCSLIPVLCTFVEHNKEFMPSDFKLSFILKDIVQ